MKELSIQEKARRYDEAIKEASIAYKDEDKHLKATLERIFPELKESEGERIRKEIIGFIKGQEKVSSLETPVYQTWLAWLEKQGKPTTIIDIDKMVSKYANTREDCTNGLPVNCQIRAYRQGINDALRSALNLEKQGEQKHKFNIGDIISNGQAVYRVDDITKNCIGQDCYFLVNVEYEKNGTRYLSLTDSEGEHSNAGEITLLCEQADKSFEKQGKQKNDRKEWSEEDEYNSAFIQEALLGLDGDDSYREKCCKMAEWLESLKDRYAWKPSEEQIGALEHFVRSIGESGFASPYEGNTNLVYSLLSELKKLREE